MPVRREALRLVVIPPPGAAGALPWSAIIAAAGEPGGSGAIELAVISTGEASLPPGVLGAVARPTPPPDRAGDVVQAELEARVRYGEAVADALAALAGAGFVPDVALADACSGAALFVGEVVDDVAVVARVDRYAVPHGAGSGRAAGSSGWVGRAQRAGLVIAEFALAHSATVVCPSQTLLETIPPLFHATCVVVADGLAGEYFAAPPSPDGELLGPGPIPGPVARPRFVVVEPVGGAGPVLGLAAAAATVGVELATVTSAMSAAQRARLMAEATACLLPGGPSGAVLAADLAAAQAANGLVIVDAAGGPAAVEHGVDGYLADFADRAQCAELLRYVTRHRDHLTAVIDAGRARARSWAPEFVARRWLDLAAAAVAAAPTERRARLSAGCWPAEPTGN